MHDRRKDRKAIEDLCPQVEDETLKQIVASWKPLETNWWMMHFSCGFYKKVEEVYQSVVHS